MAQAGPFQVRRLLHQGPHTRMYLAEDSEGRQVALKELVFALVPSAAALEAFDREAALLAQLRHPAIPRLVKSFREGEGVRMRLYLAQEFVAGESLEARLRRGPLPEAEAVEFARQALSILDHLQQLSPPVLHRDIKPANLILRPDGTLCLVDFGSARDAIFAERHRATLVGTFGYMPPEQLGGTVDRTSDLYALGATLLHLLTGRPPEQYFSPGQGLRFEQEPQLSEGMKAFLARLTALQPSARPPSAAAALQALSEALEPGQSWKKPARGRWWALLGLGISAAVVALLALQPSAEAPAVQQPEEHEGRVIPDALVPKMHPRDWTGGGLKPPVDALTLIEDCPRARQVLGAEARLACSFCGGSYSEGDPNKATWAWRAMGELAEANVTVEGQPEGDGWRVKRAYMFVKGDVYDLRPCR